MFPHPPQACTSAKYGFAAAAMLPTITLNEKNRLRWAILDSGASSHFLIPNARCINPKVATNPLRIRIPNGQTVTLSHTCLLDLPLLPKDVRIAHIVPGMSGFSLISVVKLCNAGCHVKMTDISCQVTFRGKIVVTCSKCTRKGLWLMPLCDLTKHNAVNDVKSAVKARSQSKVASPPNEGADLAYAHNAHRITKTATQAELAMYHHQSLFCPTNATLCKAINNHQFDSFPGLTNTLLKHLPPSTAMHKGHMHRTRQGVQSTRRTNDEDKAAREELADLNPPQEMCAAEEAELFCFAALADAKEGVIYTDLPCPFPIESFRQMRYIFVCYAYQPNAIMVRPMKSRSATCMVEAYKSVYDYLSDRGFKPKLNVMDNECSKVVKSYIKSQQVTLQLAEPDNHRANAAERAIKTFKNHFIAGLATVDPAFPMQLWCHLLEQAELTLNLLRTSRHDPSKSAYASLNTAFDWNRTPLAPPGTKALVYEAPVSRTSWAPHAVDGWYIGPAMDHYRCGLFYIESTRGIRIANATKLFPAHCNVPTITDLDKTLAAAGELARIIKATVSIPTRKKLEHINIIKKLSAIINSHPASRVGTQPAPRVGATTSSHDATAPRVLRTQPLIHKRGTRSNNPMPPIPRNQRSQSSNCQQQIPPGKQHFQQQQKAHPRGCQQSPKTKTLATTKAMTTTQPRDDHSSDARNDKASDHPSSLPTQLCSAHNRQYSMSLEKL